MPANPIIHVIDDDAAVRQSLAFLLSTAGLAVRVHASAVAFLKVLPEIRGGCVVTDIRMPEMDGLELQRRLLELKAGAVDFIEKPFDDNVLLSAIRSALSRHAMDSEREARLSLVRDRIKALSKREHEVLERLVAGKPNKLIAYELGISARTVEVYRANVMTKMQADSLSELVRMALLQGGSA